MFTIYLFLLITSCFLLVMESCKKDLTPVIIDQPEIKLVAEDVGVTETWLRLNIQEQGTKSQISISRDDSTIQQFNNLTTDTLIYDSSLLPNHEYTYTAKLNTDSRSQVTDNCSLTTMDTTSHDFTWETFTFGDGGTCLFRDVFIINDNDIWAVGQVWLKDSTGQFIYPPYNAIHWDGFEWGLKRILYKGGFWRIDAIYAFNENDVWFETAVRWNGVEFLDQTIPNILIGNSINKLWGISSNDLFLVGSNGLIAHFNGQTWQKLESGTELPIQDIWGMGDTTGEEKILCVASEKYEISEKKIFEINPDKIVIELDYPYNDRLHSVWFNSSNIFYVAGDEVYRNAYNSWTKYSGLPFKFINMIRGHDLNDLFICGDFGLASHFNGKEWYSYSGPVFDGNLYYSLDYKNNLVVLVGTKSGREAVITIGKRN